MCGSEPTVFNAADGTVAAYYEFGPFAEVLRATGPMAKANPFRFSTKFHRRGQTGETILLKSPDILDAIRTRRKSVENSLALEFETARFSEAPAVFWWCFWMSNFDQIPIFSRIRNLLNSRLGPVNGYD